MKHHTAEADSERREDRSGWWAWVQRNLTIATIIAMGVALMAVIAWRDGTRDDIKAGAKAAAKVEVIEKEYVPKKDLDTAITATHARIGRMESKIDTLTIEILKRLPEK